MKKILNIFKDNSGQALVESVIVFPILILMIWGIYHMHMVSFYKIKAATASRLGAWIKSMDPDIAAAPPALSEFFENSAATSATYHKNIHVTNFTPEFAPLSVVNPPGSASSAANSIFSFGASGFIGDFFAALPIFQPFVNNGLCTIQFQVKSPLANFDQKNDYGGFLEKMSNRSYFPNRHGDLWFHNSWDFFNLDLGGPLDEAFSSADAGLADAQSGYDDQSDEVDEDDLNGEAGGEDYNHDDYEEATDDWNNWRNYFN